VGICVVGVRRVVVGCCAYVGGSYGGVGVWDVCVDGGSVGIGGINEVVGGYSM
jgi:hypothetical protein